MSASTSATKPAAPKPPVVQPGTGNNIIVNPNQVQYGMYDSPDVGLDNSQRLNPPLRMYSEMSAKNLATSSLTFRSDERRVFCILGECLLAICCAKLIRRQFEGSIGYTPSIFTSALSV